MIIPESNYAAVNIMAITNFALMVEHGLGSIHLEEIR